MDNTDEKIKVAAMEGADNNYISPREVDAYIQGFVHGTDFFRDELLRGEMAAAMEWISLKGLYQEIDGRWYDKFGGKVRMVAETTEDLLKLYDKYREQELIKNKNTNDVK